MEFHLVTLMQARGPDWNIWASIIILEPNFKGHVAKVEFLSKTISFLH